MTVWTVLELLKTTAEYLDGKGVDNGRLDAERLLAQVLELDRVGLYMQFDRPMQDEELTAYRALVKRRASREPLQYIQGETEFWSLPMLVTPAVLIPRSDTEILVEEALKRLPENPRILDVGAGSGAIGIALAHEKSDAEVTALDLSAEALEVVARNADLNGVRDRLKTIQGDLAQLPEGPWDMVVSNPPYIPLADYETLMPEVRDYEPALALKAGEDGLGCYRALADQVQRILAPGGWILLEVGIGQATDVADFLRKAGLTDVSVRADYGGVDRVVCGRRP